MKRLSLLLAVLASAGFGENFLRGQYQGPIDVKVPDIASDQAVKFDYDIVYVRVPRKGDDSHPSFAEVFHPTVMDPGGDLMLLRSNGAEELLVPGGNGAVIDPYVSFDGEWVYYAKLEDIGQGQGARRGATSADIYKIHVKTRRVVQLTKQGFTPNTGAAPWAKDYHADQPNTYIASPVNSAHPGR